jgi:hypothetical protein
VFFLLLVGLAFCGCGGVKAADLFILTRTGPTPQTQLTLLVNEEGGLRCNGGHTLRLSDPQLVQARTLQEDLHDYAAKHLALAPRSGSVYSYSLRDTDGSVRFSDNSAGQARVLRDLQLFVLQVAQQVCHSS